MRMGREDIRDDHAAALIQKITKHGGAFKSVAVVEGLQRQTTVSISDCSSPAGGLQEKDGERYSNLERMKSSNNVLSRTYVTDSSDSGGEDIRRKFNIAPGEPAGVRLYKGMVPQLNGRARGTQICDKRQRVCLGKFNGDIMINKHTYEEEPSNSKNNDASRCSETNQEEEEESCKGAERNYNLGGGGNDKKASPRRREHMFEKPLTPSDVGKLNRLVIPKQHAEKYLPLDTDANEKGLLLDFEDSTGKEWQFRYSYWNSSQSYVLTKGWSRFVKEMKLKEGDIVAFHRATHKDPILQRLFISCKRNLCSAAQPTGKQGPAVKRPLQFSSPFQFPLNNIGGSHEQQLVTSRAALISPQWKPLFWPTNNVIGSHGAPETRILQTNAKPMDLLSSLHLTATADEKQRKRKGIHDLGFPFSIQRLSNTTEYGRYAVDTMNWLKAPSLRAMLKAPGISADDLSAATSFDHSTSTSTSTSVPTSKKVVRLFGVNLECGKL